MYPLGYKNENLPLIYVLWIEHGKPKKMKISELKDIMEKNNIPKVSLKINTTKLCYIKDILLFQGNDTIEGLCKMERNRMDNYVEEQQKYKTLFENTSVPELNKKKLADLENMIMAVCDSHDWLILRRENFKGREKKHVKLLTSYK